VLLHEAITLLKPRAGHTYLDGTFGAGGYTRAILAHADTTVIALDRDPGAVRAAADLVSAMRGRLELIEGRFGDLAAHALRFGPLDGVVLDIGVSSMQFDEPQRGFSFRFDAPLDMRMEQKGRTAADILADTSEEDLADILYHYGDERASRRIAREIVLRRKTSPVTTTGALADLVKRALPTKFGEIHPATRTFQALRIAVNDELGELSRALAGAEEALAPEGRLVVVTFHSLEDRIVKQFLASRTGRGVARSRRLPGEPALPDPTFTALGPQPVLPGDAEIAANPRARSAKLRAAVRTDAPPRGGEPHLLPRTPSPAPRGGAR
jgi:16S rRNA (cytosine1402-N4)-methyltransferase